MGDERVDPEVFATEEEVQALYNLMSDYRGRLDGFDRFEYSRGNSVPVPGLNGLNLINIGDGHQHIRMYKVDEDGRPELRFRMGLLWTGKIWYCQQMESGEVVGNFEGVPAKVVGELRADFERQLAGQAK